MRSNPHGTDTPYDWYNNASHALASFIKNRSWAVVEEELTTRGLSAEEIRQAIHVASSKPMVDLIDTELDLHGTELEELYSYFLGQWEIEHGDPTLATPANFLAALDALGEVDIPECKVQQLWEAYYDMYGLHVRTNPGGDGFDPSTLSGNEAAFQQIGGFVLGAIAYRVLGHIFDWFLRDDKEGREDREGVEGADLAEDYVIGPVHWVNQ